MDRLKFEKKLWNQGFKYIMGLDEVGRGSLSGPVVAAGVIFKTGTKIEGARDSKLLSIQQRLELEVIIKEEAICWTIQWCNPSIIDKLNILNASLKAMQKCSESASIKPDYLLVDGNCFGDSLCPHTCLIKGDNRSVSIAAASILAKVHRDRYMKKLHKKYPHYGWNTNVGYATKQHFAGLKKYGFTQHHRRSFRLRTEKRFEI